MGWNWSVASGVVIPGCCDTAAVIELARSGSCLTVRSKIAPAESTQGTAPALHQMQPGTSKINLRSSLCGHHIFNDFENALAECSAASASTAACPWAMT